MTNHVIFVAGGIGRRMGREIPKQFIPVGDRPLLMHAILAFEAFDPELKKIVALPRDHIDFWKSLCQQFQFTTAHEIVPGGETRFESVKNACNIIQEDQGLTAVHDGVRPFPPAPMIRRIFDAAQVHKAAIPCLSTPDSIRITDNNGSTVAPRDQIKRIQTPQVFHTRLIKKAYLQPWQRSFTDDASVVEKMGIKIHLVPGDEENLKVTTPLDLKIAIMLADKPTR